MDIVHEIYGRVRLRASSASDARLAPEFADMVSERIPGVIETRTNPAARSLIVRHDDAPQTRDSVQPPAHMPAARAFRAEPGSPPLEGRLAVGAARYLGGVIGRTIFLVLLQTTMKRLEASTQRAIVFAITGRKPVA